MPAFKAAYLVHGDDHVRIAERRARLRALAERESGVGGVEVLEADACTPEAVVAALNTMTFALGRRFVIADGVERWRDPSGADTRLRLEAPANMPRLLPEKEAAVFITVVGLGFGLVIATLAPLVTTGLRAVGTYHLVPATLCAFITIGILAERNGRI